MTKTELEELLDMSKYERLEDIEMDCYSSNAIVMLIRELDLMNDSLDRIACSLDRIDRYGVTTYTNSNE